MLNYNIAIQEAVDALVIMKWCVLKKHHAKEIQIRAVLKTRVVSWSVIQDIIINCYIGFPLKI